MSSKRQKTNTITVYTRVKDYNELNNPSDDLVREWGIYCGLKFDGSIDESNLDVYWQFAYQFCLK